MSKLEPVAWMNEGGRIIAASTKRHAERETAYYVPGVNSVSSYTIPLYTHPSADEALLRKAYSALMTMRWLSDPDDGETEEADAVLAALRERLGG